MSNDSHIHLITAVLNRPLALEAGYARTFFSALSQRLGNVQKLTDVDGSILMSADLKKEAESYSPAVPTTAVIRSSAALRLSQSAAHWCISTATSNQCRG